MPIDIALYDSAEHLKTPDHIAAHLDVVLEDNDPALLAHALGVVTRTSGIVQLAQSTSPSQLDTLISVLKVLGLRLGVRPIEA